MVVDLNFLHLLAGYALSCLRWPFEISHNQINVRVTQISPIFIYIIS